MDLPKIISVDDHVVEPPHVWQTWLPEKYREKGPRVERKKWGDFKLTPGAKYEMAEDPDGLWGDAWYYEDRLVYVHKRFVAIPQASTIDTADGVQFDRSQMIMKALTYDDMRPGCWDRDARIKDMELNWVDGSLPFPTFPRFCGQTFYEGEDKELGLACVRAYNDWMVEEWCGPSGGMNIPLCLIPLWDVEAAAAET
ncbi:MAG: amidohydrolase, partial [Actinobacteria bacterium]|nr:amidohydrolase [Actinomycetota bacterium]